ncbi:hypothetical protein CANCADRAFT_30338 [Tortispora caseinolytica NRRL Y-17796]|uniref:Fumarylacetoacetase-like C-terminal domain-containing protein n=1 Tax=Tortispora caseinolytica NRRL Y-17796 TaxID=767744 RepID=A0A1E4TK19_9ASCO|nr:hypothetical protein CANCADRAFT_30338 [Tortispora caseinolytica NRRL Y-17796]
MNAYKNCRKVICIGRNFADHIKELGNATPSEPFFFLKPPSSILLPNTGPVLLPKGVTAHYEVELALIMGKILRDLDPEDTQTALDSIGQYALAIDMTARNVQEKAKKKGLPWSISKGFDTFLPMSPPIPKSSIPDPQNVHLQLSVNGEVHQSDLTNLMLFPIPKLLSAISAVMTLEPNDIVLTGTPKGVGPVVDGDVMDVALSYEGKVLEQFAVDVKTRHGVYEFIP